MGGLGMAQAVELLISKLETLSSKSSVPKKRKKKKFYLFTFHFFTS
jgi:hypothetical protein